MSQDKINADKQLQRLQVLEQVRAKQCTQYQASLLLGVSDRHIRRLLTAYTSGGTVCQRRVPGSNRAHSPVLKTRVLQLIRAKYKGFGPTLLAEKLLEYEGLQVSRETLRQWMLAHQLWRPKRRRQARVHPSRPRRPCRGELVQIDGSDHHWISDTERHTLLVFIDDATSELLELRLVSTETTFGYFGALKRYLGAYGKPRAIYTDKHVVFKVNHPGANSGTGLTQFGRALKQLGIEIIYAHSPQAKGRVERVNRTLQDRLVKELRLKGIRDVHTANQFLNTYRLAHNRRFAVPPTCPTDLHQELLGWEKRLLGVICSVQTLRKVSNNLQVRHQHQTYQLKVPGKGYRLRRARVAICENEFGQISILHQNKPLKFSVYNEHAYTAKTVHCRRELEYLMNHRYWRLHQQFSGRWQQPGVTR